MNNNDIADALDKAVKYYGQKVDAYLSGGGYPSGKDAYRSGYKPIEKTKVIGSQTVTADKVSQTISYGSEKEAPYAIAYEFGSGEHGKEGKTYVIRPKNKKMLLVGSKSGWFPKSIENVKKSRKFHGMGDEEDRYLFSRVDHPGVAPKPFALPVLRQEINEIVKIVGQEVLASLKRTL